VANLIISFVLGATVGLLLRPVLDAYLMWRTAEEYRRDARARDRTPTEADMNHRTGP
jgi:hypothetical protein